MTRLVRFAGSQARVIFVLTLLAIVTAMVGTKNLEVNADTVATGIMPVTFGASGSIRHKSVVVEVTPDEFKSIQAGQLQLPQGWAIGDTLFQRG